MAPGNLSIIFAGRKFLRKSKDNHNNESLLDSFTNIKANGSKAAKSKVKLLCI